MENIFKKRRVFYLKYFRNYWLQKRWLLKCLKSLTSEQLSVINLLTGRKHCLNHARHYYYPIFPWILDKLSWKKSALVRSKILGLFVNTFTAEYTYSRRNMQTLTQQVHTPLSLKQKTFSGFFIAFLKSTWNGEHFAKKRRVFYLKYFRNYWLQKRWLLKCLKRLTSEQLSVINLLTGRKHCLNLHGTTIILFFHESGINWAGKSLP